LRALLVFATGAAGNPNSSHTTPWPCSPCARKFRSILVSPVEIKWKPGLSGHHSGCISP